MKSRIRNIILIGILYGGILLMLEILFKLPKEVVWKYYIIISIFIILGSLSINIIWQMNFIKKIKKLEKVLSEEQNPDKFIDEIQKLQQTIKSGYNKTILNINLSAGYCDKGDYVEAKKVLLSVPTKELKGINRVVYNINLAYICFRTDENQEALEIFEKYNKEISRFENFPSLGGSIAILRIFQHLAKDEISQADELLAISKDKWNEKRLLADWEFLQAKIDGCK